MNMHLRCVLNLAVSSHLGDQAAKCTEDKCSRINNNKKVSCTISPSTYATNDTEATPVLLPQAAVLPCLGNI